MGSQAQEADTEAEVTNVPGWTPSVTLQVQEDQETGEEEEDVTYSERAKLYRFREGAWRERGTGQAKLLQHRQTGKVRFILRQETTLKLMANFHILSQEAYCALEPLKGDDKTWTWISPDSSDGEVELQTFALRFADIESAQGFHDAFMSGRAQNSQFEDLAEGAVEGGSASGLAADAGSAGGLPALPSEKAQDQADAEKVDLGEEDAQEFVLYSQEARLCELQDGEWKDKGMGHAKLLSGEVTGRTRFVFSSDAGLKANFYIVPEDPYCDLLPGVAENSVVWTCLDGAAGKEAFKEFGLEFSNAHLVEGFRETFEEARYANAYQLSMEQMSMEYLENAAAEAEAASEAAAAGASLERTAGSPDNGHKKEAEDGSLGLVSKASPPKAPSSLFPSSWAQSESAAESPAKPAAAAPTTKKTAAAGQSKDNGEADNEEEVYSLPQGKLFCFLDGQWRERCVGVVQLLRHKDLGTVRFLMRHNKDGKVGACFLVQRHEEYCNLQKNAGNDKCWMWLAPDTSQESAKVEHFALKFSNAEKASLFAAEMERAKEMADEAAAADSAANGTAAEDAAGTERPVAAEEADVKKKEVKLVTEEEDVSSPEELVYTARAKFYNFRNDEWKQKAFGDILMSRKKDTGVVTFEMQQQSDLQVVARFEISDEGDYCILKPNFGSDRCWQWRALDTSQDGVQVEEQFAVKFPDSATAAEFALAFEDAKVKTVAVDPVAAAEKEPTEERVQATTKSTSNGATVTPSLFAAAGSTPEKSPSLFAPASSTGATSIFGSAPSAAGSAPSIFSFLSQPSSSSTAGATSSSSIFGTFSQSASTGGSLFSGLGQSSSSTSASSGGSLFSGLGQSSSSTSGSLFSGLAQSSSSATGSLFSGLAQSSSSATGSLFSGLAQSSSSSGSTTAGSSIFAPAAPAADVNGAANGEDQQDDDGQMVEEEEITTIPGWAPSVTLEVQETVDSGEEQEEELYSQRSKLFRFRDGEWKERGIGNAKLLKHKESGRVRFIMRQEKTLKIVANFYLMKSDTYCDLRPQGDSEKIWMWAALDKSEDEQVSEKFALKFGTAELAQHFFDEWEKAKHTQESEDAGTTAESTTAKAEEKATNGSAAPAPAPAPSPAPATPEKKEAAVPSLFGGSSSGGSIFSGTFGASSGAGSGFSLFGGSSASSSIFNASSTGLFSQLATQQASGGLFSSFLPSSSGSTAAPAAAASTGSLFAPSAAAPSQQSASKGEEEQDEDGYVVEEEVTAIPGWAPSVTLEVQDKVETGEEHEDELYSQRSKLFRFRDGEWKERGIGDAKLLKHKETGKVRFMMRQEKTMKIVANFYLMKSDTYCDLRPQGDSDKIWVWSAVDKSEDEQVTEKFALKFRDAELAEKFKQAFDLGKDGEGQAKTGEPTAATPTKPDKAPSSDAASSAPPKFSFSTAAPATSTAGTAMFSNLFSAATPAATASSGDAAAAAGAEDDEEYVVEEEVTAIPGWAPSVTLEVKDAIDTGEEAEEELYSQRSKLFRFRDGEWKERGIGNAKLLKHKETGKVRFMMRQEKTLKIVANFYLMSNGTYCDLRPMAGNDKIWVWSALDKSEDEQVCEMFGLKFGTLELAVQFADAFEKGKQAHEQASGGEDAPTSKTSQEKALPTATTKSEGVAAPTATAAPAAAAEANEDDDQYVAEEEVTAIPGWTPSVTLEVQDSVATGEETDEELYSQRAKLFRFRDGEWKERGLGNVRLLKNKEASRVRFLMRQEKTMKIVANFRLIESDTYCNLKPMPDQDRFWIWSALDWSEDEQVHETFALKFGSVELAATFAEAFNSAKQPVDDSMLASSDTATAGAAAVSSTAPAATAGAPSSSSIFAPASSSQSTGSTGSSSLFASLGGSTGSSLFAPAAASGPSGASSSSLFGGSPASSGSLFSGSAASTGGLFSGALAATSGGLFSTPSASSGGSTTASLFGAPAAGGSNIFSGLSFSAGSSSSLFGQPPSSSSSLFSSTASTGLFSGFAAAAAAQAPPPPPPPASDSASTGGGVTASDAVAKATAGASFANPFMAATQASGGGLFSGAGASTTARPAESNSVPEAAPATATGEQDEDGYVVEEEITTIPGWTPSVTLEVRDKVETGEEQEEEIYSQRSKLFRFRDGEWKERGIGDAKLLKHKETGKIRFMMRQEKTMKIVANFYLIKSDTYCDLRQMPDNDKIWVWSAVDKSEEEQVAEKFALKFRDTELAAAFQQAFESAREAHAKAESGTAPADSSTSAVSENGKAAASAPSIFSSAAPAPSSATSGFGLFSNITGAPVAGTSSNIFAGAAPVAATSSADAAAAGAEDEDGQYVEEEEVTAIPGWAPSVSLEVKDTIDTGEEAEEELYSQRSKLFRFRDGEWKERGIGNAKLLKHKESGKVRFMMRQEKTLKIVANFYLMTNDTYCDLRPMPGNDKIWCWSALDKSEDEQVHEMFALKFGTLELAMQFSEAFVNGKQLHDKAAKGEVSAPPPADAPRAPTQNAQASSPPPAAKDQAEDDDYVVEEEVTAIPGWTPSVTLEVKDSIDTGEEAEEELYSQRAKIFRFRDGEWKERGLGNVKLLLNKDDGKVRFVMRQEKTLKIVANFYLIESDTYCNLKPMPDQDKFRIWSALDWSEEEQVHEKFAVKLASAEIAAQFEDAFNSAKRPMEEAVAPSAPSTSSKPAPAPGGASASSIFAPSAPAASGSSRGSSLFGGGASLFGGGGSGSSLLTSATSSAGLFSSLAAASGSGSSLFGGWGSGSAGSTAPSLFASPASTSGGLFSSLAPAAPAPSAGASSSSLFGSPAASTSGGLFSAPSSGSTGGLFSMLAGSTGASSSISFGGGASSGGSSLFGGAAPSTLFGQPPSSTAGASSGSLFGASAPPAGSGSIFQLATAQSSPAGIFAMAAQAPPPPPPPPPPPAGAEWTGGEGSQSSAGFMASDAVARATAAANFCGGVSFSSPFQPPAPAQASGGGIFSLGGGGVAGVTSGAGLLGNSASSSAPPPRPPAEPAVANDEALVEEDDQYVVEEELTTIPGWAPSVTLEVSETIETGEENEEELYSLRSKLFRFRDGEWKERGVGFARILKRKDTGKVRFMLRQEKTLKVVANFYIIRHDLYCDLRPNAGNEKFLVWTALDHSEDEQVVERFALKFPSPELAAKFTEAFEEAKLLNEQADGTSSEVGLGASRGGGSSGSTAPARAAAKASSAELEQAEREMKNRLQDVDKMYKEMKRLVHEQQQVQAAAPDRLKRMEQKLDVPSQATDPSQSLEVRSLRAELEKERQAREKLEAALSKLEESQASEQSKLDSLADELRAERTAREQLEATQALETRKGRRPQGRRYPTCERILRLYGLGQEYEGALEGKSAKPSRPQGREVPKALLRRVD